MIPFSIEDPPKKTYKVGVSNLPSHTISTNSIFLISRDNIVDMRKKKVYVITAEKYALKFYMFDRLYQLNIQIGYITIRPIYIGVSEYHSCP